jgi:phospholipid/cholesterol/gamma-HCH transport system permease protein
MTFSLRKSLTSFADNVGILAVYLWEALGFIFRGKIRWEATLYQIASIGYDSLPMALLICVISGSVLALQTAEKFAQTGADAYVGGLVSVAIVREIAPIFACLAVSARSGTAIASEIANMKVTDQIDALKIMHVSPIRYLMVPKLIGCIISLPLLTLLGEIAAVIGGGVVAQGAAHLHFTKYFESVWLHLAPYDIEVSLIKAVVFGVLLASIACTVGLTTKGGAKDVGLSTTKAAVAVSLTIVVVDFVLTWIFFGTTFDGQ